MPRLPQAAVANVAGDLPGLPRLPQRPVANVANVAFCHFGVAKPWQTRQIHLSTYTTSCFKCVFLLLLGQQLPRCHSGRLFSSRVTIRKTLFNIGGT